MTSIPHPEDHSHISTHAHVGPAYQAYRFLQAAFVAVPIVAGVDKFIDKLTDWDMYLAPQIAHIVGSVHPFMMIVGIIEIIAGIGVLLKPKVFGYVVAAWLMGIILNLLLCGSFIDIALRDFGLCLSALGLARLAWIYDIGMAGGVTARR